MDIPNEVLAADERIGDHVRRTPLEFSHFLSSRASAEVHLKQENLQRTGSFKFRGAMNKLLSLSAEERARGVTCASTGNHGAAVACGAQALGIPAIVFAPENAAPGKMAAIEALGAEVRRIGDDCLVSEAAARAFTSEAGLTYISPYNDEMVVAGQGTIGCEIGRELETADVVYVSVGGGGLISGVAGYLKSLWPDVRIVGCSPRNSAVMAASIEAGRVLDLESDPTLSDGTAGGLEADSITFPICCELIDDFILVEEDEIASAVRDIVAHHHMLIEGAAGVAVAACLRDTQRAPGERAVVLLCGANIDAGVLKGLL